MVQDDVVLDQSPGIVEKDSFGMKLWSLFSCVGDDLKLKEELSKADAGGAKMASFDHASEASSPPSPSSPALLPETVNGTWEPQPVKTVSIKVAAPILFPPSNGFRSRQRQGGGGWSSWDEKGGQGGAGGGARIPNPPESSGTGAYKGR